MANFPEMELDGTLASFAGLQELFGFVPNLFRVQALLPRVIEAEAGMARAILHEKTLSRKEKLVILLAVAAAHRNTHCATTCHGILRSLGVADRQLEELIDSGQVDQLVPDTALLDFALKLATNARWFSGRDIVALRARGFQDEAILEVVLIAALSRFFCTLSIGLGPAPDFEPRTLPRQNTSLPEERSYLDDIPRPYLRQVELSPARFPPFAFFLEWFGFVPNLFRAQTLRPDVIAAEAGLVRTVLVPNSFLSRVQKECIFLVGSAANLNTSCVAIHCEALRAQGVLLEESEQIALNHHQTDLSETNKALLDFTRKLAVRPSEFHSDDINNLRRHGFTEGHILEAVVATALNNFFNLLQIGLGTAPDVEIRLLFGPQGARTAVGNESLPGDLPLDPDAALVMGVQNGNRQAFEELFARHSHRIYRTLVCIIRNAEEAQDAMQDTFLRALIHIDDFQRRSKFSTWLTSIANNIALQRLRDQRRLDLFGETRDESEFHARQERAWDADPEQLYSQAERRRLVESGLMKMPSKYRAVLILRDIRQLSTEEAATALSLGIPALKARLFRARKMLREALLPHFTANAQKMDKDT